MSIHGTLTEVVFDRLAVPAEVAVKVRTSAMVFHGKTIAAGLIAVSSLWGCTDPDGTANKTGTGAIIGGLTGVAAGQIVGAGTGGTILGGAVGAGVGGLIGADKDARDR